MYFRCLMQRDSIVQRTIHTRCPSLRTRKYQKVPLCVMISSSVFPVLKRLEMEPSKLIF
ncbi:unnamed protein product [Brassica oleracea var. botrytis]